MRQLMPDKYRNPQTDLSAQVLARRVCSRAHLDADNKKQEAQA